MKPANRSRSFANKLIPSPSMAVAMLALMIALTGTAWAAVTINGKNIKKGTIAGSKLKKNTVTGTYIKESTLGEVPSAANAKNSTNAANSDNAAALGGLAASSFVQGGGHIYSGQKNGASSSNDNVVLSVPGVGRVEFDCAANGVDSTPYFVNTSGESLYVMGQTVARDGTPSNTDEANIAPNVPGLANGAAANLQSAQQLSTRTAGSSTFQVWSSSGEATRATFVVSSIFCSYTATAATNK